MAPRITIELPSNDFDWCERQLTDAGLSPYVSTRTTVEWLHLDCPADVTVEGQITLGGERLPFTWCQRPEAAEFEIYYGAAVNREDRDWFLAILDELEKVFLEREQQITEPQPPAFRDRFAEALSLPVGCALVVFVIGAILFLAGYGVFALLHRP